MRSVNARSLGANGVKSPQKCGRKTAVASLEIIVDDAGAGERLDVAIRGSKHGLSRNRIRILFEAGEVQLNGRPAKKGDRVAAGDRITLASIPKGADFYAAPDAGLDLRLAAVTERFVVVDKAAGTPSHPLQPDEMGSVANALVARFPEMRDVGYRRREPGLVHRLDTGTSGLMLAARDQAMFERLRDALRAGAIEKRYLARCLGAVRAPQCIELPIATDPKNTRRVRACTDPRQAKRLGAQRARTEVLRMEPRSEGCLVEVRANHARRHQIRAHLAAIGHPLLGDTLYGGPTVPGITFHLLHASAITLPGETLPITSDWNQ